MIYFLHLIEMDVIITFGYETYFYIFIGIQEIQQLKLILKLRSTSLLLNVLGRVLSALYMKFIIRRISENTL